MGQISWVSSAAVPHPQRSQKGREKTKACCPLFFLSSNSVSMVFSPPFLFFPSSLVNCFPKHFRDLSFHFLSLKTQW